MKKMIKNNHKPLELALIDAVQFTKLDLRNDDVLILRTQQSDDELAPMADALARYLEKTNLLNIVLITLKPDESLRNVDAEQMLLCGWVKVQEDNVR